MLFHFLFWVLEHFPTFVNIFVLPVLAPNTVLKPKLLPQALNAYTLLYDWLLHQAVCHQDFQSNVNPTCVRSADKEQTLSFPRHWPHCTLLLPLPWCTTICSQRPPPKGHGHQSGPTWTCPAGPLWGKPRRSSPQVLQQATPLGHSWVCVISCYRRITLGEGQAQVLNAVVFLSWQILLSFQCKELTSLAFKHSYLSFSPDAWGILKVERLPGAVWMARLLTELWLLGQMQTDPWLLKSGFSVQVSKEKKKANTCKETYVHYSL